MRPLPILLALLTATAAMAGCTNDSRKDSDSDGLNDALERLIRDVVVDRANGSVTLRVNSDEHALDSDGDGLSDLDEYARKTDPRDVDTDQDGVLDGENVTATGAFADRLRARGIVETPAGNFLGELGLCEPLGGKSAHYSSDRPFADRLPDGEEVRGWNVTVRGATRHVVGDPCVADADQDGAPDERERELATDPRLADTDGDGALDGYDHDALWDLSLGVNGLVVGAANGTVRITFNMGSEAVTASDGAAVATFSDVTAGIGNVTGIVFAMRAEDAGPVRLFGADDAELLSLDVANATLWLGNLPFPEGTVETSGEDGTLRFTWTLLRR